MATLSKQQNNIDCDKYMINTQAKYGLASDSFGNEEIEAAIEVLRSRRYTMGEMVYKFEEEFAKWIGAQHTIMVNSGSSANLIAIDALMKPYNQNRIKLRPGDEVLVPALAWPTTVWPLVQLGLVPVFVDVDLKTMAISLESAKKSLSPKTKGMFLIHVLGQACSMKDYETFCEKNGITLIEDCCESFGAYDQKKHVGMFGAAGTYSHYYSHHLTTIEGGTVATNDSELADDLRSQRAHGWTRNRTDQESIKKENPHIDSRFLFVTTGYNIRPMELQAAIGSVQLKRMDQFMHNRQENARAVDGFVKKYAPWLKMSGAELLPKTQIQRNERRHSWMNICFMVEKSSPFKMDVVKNMFENAGVETRPIIAGNLARHPVCQNIKARFAKDLSVCDHILEDGFMIGCHPNSSAESLAHVENAFQSLSKL